MNIINSCCSCSCRSLKQIIHSRFFCICLLWIQIMMLKLDWKHPMQCLGSSCVWADWYNASEIEWNYAEEYPAEEHRGKFYKRERRENADRSTSADYRLLQKHRESLLEYRTNTICIEHSGYLLSGISYYDRKYNEIILIFPRYKIIKKFQSIGVPGGSMILVKSVFFYIVMSLEAFIYCFVGEHLSTKVRI